MKNLVAFSLLLAGIINLSAQEGNRKGNSSILSYEKYETEINTQFEIEDGNLTLSSIGNDSSVIYTYNETGVKIKNTYNKNGKLLYLKGTFKNALGLDSLTITKGDSIEAKCITKYDEKGRVIALISSSKYDRDTAVTYSFEYEDKINKKGSSSTQSTYITTSRREKVLISKSVLNYNKKGELISKEVIFPKQPKQNSKKALEAKSKSISDTTLIQIKSTDIKDYKLFLEEQYAQVKSKFEDSTKDTVHLVFMNEDKSVVVRFSRCTFGGKPIASLSIRK